MVGAEAFADRAGARRRAPPYLDAPAFRAGLEDVPVERPRLLHLELVEEGLRVVVVHEDEGRLRREAVPGLEDERMALAGLERTDVQLGLVSGWGTFIDAVSSKSSEPGREWAAGFLGMWHAET